jgi:predicted RND superfamily exporter protein
LFLLPPVLSFLPPPKERHMRYLYNRRLQWGLSGIERWALNHRKAIFGATAIVLLLSIAGMTRLRSVGYIVDDVPKRDKIYTDLKFFEENFGGVMPLEVVIDTKRRQGVTRNLQNMVKMDSMVQYLSLRDDLGKALTLTEGLKFAKQAFFEGDSTFFAMPGENDLLALRPYLSQNAAADSNAKAKGFSRLISSFMDRDRQQARISVTMKDVGSERLPDVLNSIQTRAEEFLTAIALKRFRRQPL